MPGPVCEALHVIAMVVWYRGCCEVEGTFIVKDAQTSWRRRSSSEYRRRRQPFSSQAPMRIPFALFKRRFTLRSSADFSAKRVDAGGVFTLTIKGTRCDAHERPVE